MNEHLTAQTQTPTKPTFMPIASGLLQRQCACGQHGGSGGECEACKQKREGALQRAAINPSPVHEVPPIVHEVVRSSGQPLDAKTRAFMEPRFGHDFSQVQVHTDAQAAESARAVNALAYAIGRDIVFGTGQYAPNSLKGRWMLAHELVHVAQQGDDADGTSALPAQLNMSMPGDRHEVEADRLADHTLLASAETMGRPSLNSPLAIQRVHPALVAAGVLAAIAACAYGFYRYTLNHYSGRQGYNDKFMHCYTSCKIASWCGGGPTGPGLVEGLAISEVLGILKEVADYIKNELHIGTPADASWDDWIADQYGLLCALNLFTSCADCCRNAPGAVSPRGTAQAETNETGTAVAASEIQTSQETTAEQVA